jgi:multiple sugar transport system permease protein
MADTVLTSPPRPAPDRATVAGTPRPSENRRRASAIPYVMLIPAIVLFVLFMAAPIVYTIYLSFQKMEVAGLGLGPDAQHQVFAGLGNYVKALSDSAFLQSCLRVLLYGLILVPSMLILALLFALLLDSRRSRARTFSRVSIFLPYAVPTVISSLIWGFLYLPSVSPFYSILKQLGWSDPPQILSNNLVIFAIANIALWGGVGFNMVIMYTSLKSIPTELYEAAKLDGASEIQISLRIKVPIIMPAIIMTAIFALISTLQVFSEPTTLMPLSNAISSTFTPLMTVYRDAFTRNDIYTASATSVVIAVAIFALSFGFLRLIQRRAFDQEN